MGRPAVGLLAIVAIIGGWLLTQNLSWRELTSEISHQLPGMQSPYAAQPVSRTRSIRVATFDVDGFGREQLESLPLLQMLCQVIEPFDVVAIQNIQSEEAYIVPTIVDTLQARGGNFEYAVSKRTGRESPKQQFAYLYRANRVQLDRASLYQVLDPDDLLTHEPFVASFRVKGVPAERAFTFTLVNTLVSSNPLEAARERTALWDVWQAVLADGRREDDIILLGNFQSPSEEIARCLPTKDLSLAVVERPTDLGYRRQHINLVLSKRATVEFTGRSGVFDLVREFNLSLDDVRPLSESLPVWAEFTLNEGGAFH